MSSSDRIVRVPLHEVAHGRTGDKGNRVNISVIPYQDDAWPLLLEQLTPERVKAWFAAKGAGTVVRYELANLKAMNFVIDDVLQGGVNGALNLDGHGKSLAFHLLSIPVEVPARLALHPDKALG